MAKIGDRVRYLNDIGGGIITKIDGKLAYVDDNGFETPVLLKELVVVLPAGHETEAGGANLMFDQKAFDKGRQSEPQIQNPGQPAVSEPANGPVEETSHGEKLNILLAFEPSDAKQLSKATFNAVLVNDSNYFLNFAFLSRHEGEHGWKIVFKGEVMPNELIDLAQYSHENIREIEKVALQCIAYKTDKTFPMKSPVSAVRKIDLTKFHKLHCFRTSVYFDTPVLEFPLVTDDLPVRSPENELSRIVESAENEKISKENAALFAGKYHVSSNKKKHPDTAGNPYKLLPLIVTDLHIAELVDTTAGMDAKAILTLQLDTVRKTMNAHSRRKGQKLVFIHGKGEGVLRKAVWDLIRKEYPRSELQDASFREYGFGAALVTIH